MRIMDDEIVEVVARAIMESMAQRPVTDDQWAAALKSGEDADTMLTWATAALSAARPMIEAEVRERCAKVAEQWRDENKAAAAKARKRSRAMAGTPFEDPNMADMLEGAAIECNAIAAAIRALGDGGEDG